MVDTFRKKYKPLNSDQKKEVALIKDGASELLSSIESFTRKNNKEEMVEAKKYLKNTVMWAVNGITK